jgi:hypothetical protein
MNFTVNKTEAAVVEKTGGGNYISKSGIYDVTILFASVATSKGGAKSINFNIEYNGNKQTIYGPYVMSKAGAMIEIGAKTINKAFVLAGMEGSIQTTKESFRVGKDNEEQEFDIYEGLSDFECKMRLQEEYSRYNGISKKLVIRNFYDIDGGTAEENIKGTDKGVTLTKDLEYADRISYVDSSKGANDAPTPEEVAEWAEAKKTVKPGSTPTQAAAPKTVTKPTGDLFG